MTTSAKIGYGSSLTWNGNTVVELTKIGAIELTATELDATSLSSPDSYKEKLPGLLDAGSLEIEGWFRPDDTDGQFAMLTDFNNRQSRTFVVNFNVALSTTTWTGTAYLKRYRSGDVTMDGLIPFAATLMIAAKPTLGVTAATGPTDIVVTGDVSGALAEIPTYAAGTYTYAVDGAAENSVTVTVTAAGADTITVNGNSVASGVASGAIALTSGAITEITVVVGETNKSSKTYTIRVSDGL